MRSHLISAGPKLVSIKSTNEINVEDVTEHAQVSRTTFYQCFRSLNYLLNASAKQAALELTSLVALAGSKILDVPLRMTAKTRIGIRLLTGMPLLAW